MSINRKLFPIKAHYFFFMADELMTCCCCTIHKNGETMKNVLKQQILMRNILTQVLDEIQNLKIPQLTNTVETTRESVFVTFNFFPINNDEHLNLVEIYLENQTNFKATGDEFSKIGGTCIYDFIRRCLNISISNSFASLFSWHGAKKKRVFGDLKLAKMLLALGPILPQLPVYGKQLGISSMVMGTVTGILPIVFIFAKPAFGIIVDVYRTYRKTIFMLIIVVMVVCFALMILVPPEPNIELHFSESYNITLRSCNETDKMREQDCNSNTTRVICTSECLQTPSAFILNSVNSPNSSQQYTLCYLRNETLEEGNDTFGCDIMCSKDFENNGKCLYKSFTFWSFVILMSLGSIGFNVVNSISDAICFDVIGEQFDYGRQRVWGAIGFGIFALIGGFAVDCFSGSSITYKPAVIVMIIGTIFDLFACVKLELPIMEAPKNIFKDLQRLMNNKHVLIFMVFSVCAGIVDSFIIYYLFWYLEDLAEVTQTTNIKLLEGLIVAAETLGGEVLFFSISGKILERFGHVHCFSMCFINYALRLGLISVAPSPWWILPIEFVFQGPTYALTYTTIVAYANELAPPGASATMQGIAAGMDDGFGYAVGSFIGGVLYKYLGGKNTLHLFSVFGALCSVTHLVLHKTILNTPEDSTLNGHHVEYNTPEEALKVTINNTTSAIK